MITDEERAKLKAGDVVYYASKYKAYPVITKVDEDICGNLAFVGFQHFELFDDLNWIDYFLSKKECITRMKEKMQDYKKSMLMQIETMQKEIEEINKNLESLENGE